MNYGHFDLKNKEYVITRPDTPMPWANYLGDPEYGALSQAQTEELSVTASTLLLLTSPADTSTSRTAKQAITGLLHGLPFASPLTSTRASAATVLLTPLSPLSTRTSRLRLLTTFPEMLFTRFGLPRSPITTPSPESFP